MSQGQGLLDALDLGGPDRPRRIAGLVVGIVTNNQDPEGLGRVRVAFPWLSDQDESAWARVVTPMAGKDRGLFLLPEVGDEVAVAFEHGDARFPYVLGGVWNGQDGPPAANEDGRNDLRLLKSRSGHQVRLEDKDGAERVLVVDKSGRNSVAIDTATNTVTVTAEAGVTLEAVKGKVTIRGEEVEVTATRRGVRVRAGAEVDIRGTTETNIKGGTVNIN